MDNICFSGGAKGYDTAWGDAAKAAGHKVIHYVFKNHHGSNHDDAVVVTPDDLLIGDPILKRVNTEVLHRSFPAHSDFVTNLLRRNYWQVNDTDSVYAIAGIDDKGIVIGGTAWAVECFKMLKPNSNQIFVYDSYKDQWYQWYQSDLNGMCLDTFGWWKIKMPPKPSGKWTGIGSRETNKKGLDMIKELFNE